MWASKIQCPDEDTDFVSGNLSGLCLPSTRAMSDNILSGRIPDSEVRGAVTDTLRREAVWVPVLSERRIMALGQGITGPAPALDDWDHGVAGAAQWKVAESAAEDDDRDNNRKDDRADDEQREPEPEHEQ